MKKTIITLQLLLATGLPSLFAQADGNFNYNNAPTVKLTPRNPPGNAVILNNNEVTIEVKGLSNIVADNYVAVFNLVQIAETIENTDQLMNARISNFKQKLKAIGIDTSEINTDMVSFVPKYDVQEENKVFSKTFNEVPSGFELQKNVSVHFKHSATINDIVSAAAKSEIYDLVKVDYFSSGFQLSLDSLRQKCLLKVKAKTKAYEGLGFKLDTLKKVMVDDFSTIYPATRYFSYQAFSRPSLNAARKKTVTVNEAAKTISRYYNQLDYDDYDIIINPVVIEPVIQVSYSVTVKYFLKAEEKQSNNYYILSPTGEVKQFFPK
jgi:uncharacterized protein YggE